MIKMMIKYVVGILRLNLRDLWRLVLRGGRMSGVRLIKLDLRGIFLRLLYSRIMGRLLRYI